MTKNRIEMRIETHEVKVIRIQGRHFSIYCEHCGKAVTTPTTNHAAELLQLDEGEIRHLIEKHKKT